LSALEAGRVYRFHVSGSFRYQSDSRGIHIITFNIPTPEALRSQLYIGRKDRILDEGCEENTGKSGRSLAEEEIGIPAPLAAS